jgi:hypothetical protein
MKSHSALGGVCKKSQLRRTTAEQLLMLVVAYAVGYQILVELSRREVKPLGKPAEILPPLRHLLLPLGHTGRQLHNAFVQPEPR